MKEFLSATNSTNSTFITMKLLLLSIIIIEFANIAKIFPHVDTTVGTNPSNLLLLIANRTYHLLNVVPNNFMTILVVAQRCHGFVMAVAAWEDLVAAWGSNFAASLVMLASVLHFSKVFLSLSGSVFLHWF